MRRRNASAVTTSATTIATNRGTRTRALDPVHDQAAQRDGHRHREDQRARSCCTPARDAASVPAPGRHLGAPDVWRQSNGCVVMGRSPDGRTRGSRQGVARPSAVVTTSGVPAGGGRRHARRGAEGRAPRSRPRRRHAAGVAGVARSLERGDGPQQARRPVRARARWPSALPPWSRARPPSPAPGPATRRRPRWPARSRNRRAPMSGRSRPPPAPGAARSPRSRAPSARRCAPAPASTAGGADPRGRRGGDRRSRRNCRASAGHRGIGLDSRPCRDRPRNRSSSSSTRSGSRMHGDRGTRARRHQAGHEAEAVETPQPQPAQREDAAAPGGRRRRPSAVAAPLSSGAHPQHQRRVREPRRRRAAGPVAADGPGPSTRCGSSSQTGVAPPRPAAATVTVTSSSARPPRRRWRRRSTPTRQLSRARRAR